MKINKLNILSFKVVHRHWHDMQEIASARAIIRIIQQKGGLGRR